MALRAEEDSMAKFLSQVLRMPMVCFDEIVRFLVGAVRDDRQQAAQNFRNVLQQMLLFYSRTMVHNTANKEHSYGKLSITVVSLAGNHSVNSVDIAACTFLVNAVDELLTAAGEAGLPSSMVYARDIDLQQQLEDFKQFRAKGFVGLNCGGKAEELSALLVACSRLQQNPNAKGRHFWLLSELIRGIA